MNYRPLSQKAAISKDWLAVMANLDRRTVIHYTNAIITYVIYLLTAPSLNYAL